MFNAGRGKCASNSQLWSCLDQEHQFRAGSKTNWQRGVCENLSFFSRPLQQVCQFAIWVFIHPPKQPKHVQRKNMCFVYCLLQHKTSWTPFATDDGWPPEVLDMPFSLWSDGGEFGFLDPLQNQHTRGPCILAWEMITSGWLWCIDLWKEKKSWGSLQGMCVFHCFSCFC